MEEEGQERGDEGVEDVEGGKGRDGGGREGQGFGCEVEGE